MEFPRSQAHLRMVAGAAAKIAAELDDFLGMHEAEEFDTTLVNLRRLDFYVSTDPATS